MLCSFTIGKTASTGNKIILGEVGGGVDEVQH